jgi:alkylation response protein AidB-like acyl-CoA dehydrogenase
MMIELSELRDAAQKAFPIDGLRPSRDASWALIADMGWLMMPLSEAAGGLGLGRDAVTAIHFEMGRVLSRAPLIPALLGLQALQSADALADQAGWLERMAGGEYIAVSMVPANSVTANGEVLTGTLGAVADADMASHILVTTAGLVALVPRDGMGVTLTERPLWDESRRLFEVTLDGYDVAPELVVARAAAADAITASLRAELLVAMAADALGAANATLDMTVDYLKTRKQFDRPLAMFQALKHRCADLKTRIVSAEALLWARAGDAGASEVQLGALKALACEVFRFTAEEAIQLHGGIGLTEEHNCHLFMKRAELDRWLGGGADDLFEAAGRAALAA